MGSLGLFLKEAFGVVNYRLFNSINVFYPPKVLLLPSQEDDSKDGDRELVSADEHLNERIAALNQSLVRQGNAEDVDQEPEMDEFPNTDDQDKIEEMKREAARITKLKTLFAGHKFFLNREIPREPLTFVIRCGGGQVSWDREIFPGATFDVSDESITHQIVDRDNMETQYLSRTYIQPQWIFDSFNARELLPVENYFPGAILPPHVSPFHVEREGDYVPPEKRKLFDLERGILTGAQLALAEKKDDSEEEEYEDDDEQGGEVGDEDDNAEGDESLQELLEGDVDAKRKALKKQMKVQPGKAEDIDLVKMKEGETKEQYRLRVMMIKNKHKRLYNRMMKSRQRRKKEADRLETKRQSFQEKTSPSKANKKGKGKKAAV
jgi:pescadillo protein